MVGNENDQKLTLWPIFFYYSFTCLNRERFFWGCFWKIYIFNIYLSTHLDKGWRNAHPFSRFAKCFYLPPICLNRESRFVPPPKKKVYENKKIPPIYQIEGEKWVWVLYWILIGNLNFSPNYSTPNEFVWWKSVFNYAIIILYIKTDAQSIAFIALKF